MISITWESRRLELLPSTTECILTHLVASITLLAPTTILFWISTIRFTHLRYLLKSSTTTITITHTPNIISAPAINCPTIMPPYCQASFVHACAARHIPEHQALRVQESSADSQNSQHNMCTGYSHSDPWNLPGQS